MSDLTQSGPDPRRAARVLAIVGVAVPLAITLVAVALQLVWLPDLPDPAATHWSGSGGPDGFGSAWVFPISTAAVGLLLPLMVAVTLPTVRRGAGGFAARLLGAASLGLSGMMAVTMTGSVAVQRGLDDAADAPGVGGVVIASLAVLVVLSAVGWFVVPRIDAARPHVVQKGEATIPLAAGDRVAWVATASASSWLWLIAVVPIGAAVWVVAAGPSEASPAWVTWLMVGVVALVVAALLMFTSFGVFVDERGLTVRSTAGWPRLSVPLDEIEDVAVVEIEPLGDFGGWGLRMIPGATGVVVRRGEALQVTRSGGKRLVVTVDDARTAADLLTSLRGTHRS